MKSIAAFLVLALIWFSGLLAFASRVLHESPARAPTPAQGIVALTGAGSNARLSAAVGLLEDGYGRRVLVSGVNRQASREDIRNVSRAVRRLYDCCVDLGFNAADTVGNARETADWAQAMRYRELIVVTSDYHMPRAMLELNAVLRDTGITIFLVEHIMEAVRKLCPRCIVANAGAVIADGPTEAVLADPEVRRAYLGEAANV